MSFADTVARRLAELASHDLLRRPHVGSDATGRLWSEGGAPALNFSSNNYLGLAGHPRLVEVQRDALLRWGTSSSASRLVTGSLDVHRAAERAFCSFVGLPDARLFSSGYAANVGAISALVGPGDIVLSDTLNHASLIDGCRLSRATVLVYRHNDVDHVAELLRDLPADQHVLLVTDAVFSMDGDVAPLAALADLARRHRAGLFVDEAHSLGILGPHGRGACAAEGIVPDVMTAMLGKSAGLTGALVAGSEALTSLVENRARSYVFSTAIAPALAAAVPAALSLLAEADTERERVLRHANRLVQHLTPGAATHRSPVVSWILGEPAATMATSRRLLERGVFVRGIRPPTVPRGTSRLRIVPTALHTDDDISFLLAALDDFLSLEVSR